MAADAEGAKGVSRSYRTGQVHGLGPGTGDVEETVPVGQDRS